MDASISNLDSWQGKEKWKYIKKIVTDPKINDKIKTISPIYILFGSKIPNYYKDCSDFEVIVKPGKYNQALLKKSLMDVKPSGVSALLNSLKKAYGYKPEKIFIFADSSDACKGDLTSSLKTLIRKNKNTQIVVFVLGQIRKADQLQLKELAEKTGGKFYQPDNYEILLKTFLSELILSYELYSQGELIKREPLGSRKFRLVPGTYTLKIPYGNKYKSEDFVVRNSLTTTLVIHGKNNEVHIKETTKDVM